MSHSSPKDPGQSREPLTASQSGSFDTNSLLLDLIRTDAGADALANTLKDRQIRDALKQRGVQVLAATDVGYNCLPLELRDQIRGYVIADLESYERSGGRRKCCPRMSQYACIDAEWRAAIESITFESIRIGYSVADFNKDLECFARYVVGNRRGSLQHVRLPCTVPVSRPSSHRDHDDEEKVYIFTNLIRRLFNCIGKWHDVDTRGGDFHLELERIYLPGWSDPGPRDTNDARSDLSGLPMAPIVTTFTYSGRPLLGIEVFLALLSRMPRLRHLSIGWSDLDFKPWEKRDGGHDCPSRVQLFFVTLSQTVPSLKGLKISTEMEYMDCPMPEYRKALMSYSQKLYDMSLVHTFHEDILDCFSPFCTEKPDAHAPSLLSWPNLTTLKIQTVLDAGGKEETVERMNQLMVVIGRAVRHMPLIQSLELEMEYTYRETRTRREINYIFFTLRVPRNGSSDRPQAELLISSEWFKSEWNVVEAVVSEEVTELWREGLYWKGRTLSWKFM